MLFRSGFTDPFPKDHIFLHRRALYLALCTQVEDLQCLPAGFESNHQLRPMHYGTVGLDRPPNDILCVLEVDNDDFGRSIIIYFLAYANVVVGLQCTGVESY